MLVRFLSFAASVIGTRRYRPLLISCVAIILSVASITAATSVFSSKPHRAASTAEQKTAQADQQTASPLDGLDKQTTRETPAPTNNAEQSPAQPASSDTTNSAANGPASQPAAPAAVQVILSNGGVTLSADNPTTTLSAVTSDKSAVTWTIAADSSDTRVLVNLDQAQAAQGMATVKFRLLSDAEPGIYQFTITAKDAARGIDIIKKVTVTVNS